MKVFAGYTRGVFLGSFILLFTLLSSETVRGATLTSIDVAPENPTINVGQLQPFTATGRYSDGSTRVLSPGSHIAAGAYHTCAVLSDGTVQCWGFNFDGELGNGTNANSNTPVSVSGISAAAAIAGGDYHSCAVLSDGTVQCWGNNFSGQLGNGTNTNSNTPFSVSGISTATAIAAGSGHTCAVLSDGTVQCWGYNGYGQLGDGTNTDSNIPVSVSGISTAIAIAAGSGHTCALLSDGTVQCWGYNGYGQLGDGTNANSNIPVSVSSISTATGIAARSGHTCAVLSDGTVKCWGYNYFGQLGNGTNTNSNVPVSVSGISTTIAVADGDFHTCAVLSDGTVQCWGFNASGQLGDGISAGPDCNGYCSDIPVTVSGISTATAIAAGSAHTCAVLSDGTVQCWGENSHGELGNGTNTNSNIPVSVSGIGSALAVSWTSSNPTVATINANGVAAGQSPGTTTITATSGGLSGSTVVTVGSPDQPPVAYNHVAIIAEDLSVRITLSATDVDSPSLNFAIVSPPIHGTISAIGGTGCLPNGGGSICIAHVSYTPNKNYNGRDSFTYQTTDGTLNSNVATVYVKVNPANDAPLAIGRSATMTVNTPVGILLVGYDIDSPSLTFAIETPPAHGALGAIGAPNCSPSGAGSICTATAIYTPNANYIGADSFTYSSYDGSLTSVPATVSLTVNPLSQTDLVMTNVTPNSSTVNQGGPLSVTDTVSNLGAASGGLRIAYHLSSDAVYGNGDDVAIPTVRVVISLAKGTSSTGTTALLVPSTTPPGSYYICAMADSLNQVAESNESNNTLCSSIQVTVPPPDLIISALSTTATTATKGHSFSISFTIKNQGGSKAGGFMTGFHLSTDADYGGGDDVPVNQTLSLPSLGVGANYSNGAFGLVVPSTTPSGTYYVCGMTDKNNAVAESDEGNNTNCTGTMITVP